MKTVLKLNYIIILFLALTVFFTGCKVDDSEPEPKKGLAGILVPDGFTFETTEEFEINLKIVGDGSQKYEKVKFFIYDGYPDSTGVLITSGGVNQEGIFKTIISKPLTLDSLYVSSNITGVSLGMVNVSGGLFYHEFVTEGKLPLLTSSKSRFTDIISDFSDGLDGWQPYRDNSIFTSDAPNTPIENGPTGSSDKFIWGFDTRGGLRSYEAPAKFSGDMYGQYIAYHYYLGNTVQARPVQNNIADIRITDGNKVLAIDLSSTFQHEVNAGWQTIYCKLDETETSGSGWRIGNMGIYTTGNGGKSTPKKSATTEEIQQILSNVTGILLGPEYQVGYYSSNGPEFIALGKVGIVSDVTTFPVLEQGQQMADSDGDGVPDDTDDYPDDGNKAYNNYGPGEDTYGTLAYEDLWPITGDYDFNDVVIDYNFNVITNASNKVVEMDANFVLKATGAGFLDGFAFEVPVIESKVTSVTGQEITGNTITLSANGTEADQTNAVIVVFTDAHEVFGQSGFVNTDPSLSYVTPVELNLVIGFDGSIEITDLGAVPYNPFIISNQRRGYEIHLPGYSNTDLADETIFGTSDDRTNPLTSKYYQTANNLPWAIHLPVSFEYPQESNSIETAYLRFVEWAESGGASYPDWYTDKSGYRNTDNIYTPTTK